MFKSMKLPRSPHEGTGWPWTDDYSYRGSNNRCDLPKITVVTPSYNQSEYLEATIRSVILQKYPFLEYIVIDGGSTDGSLDIIRAYSPWLTHWVSEPDHGQYHAINKGLSMASGEIMTWINSDDMLCPYSLWIVGEIFASLRDVDWITGTKMYWDETGQIATIMQSPVFFRRLIRAGLYQGALMGWIQQEGTFWRRSLWNKAGHLDDGLHSAADFNLWTRLSKFADLYLVRSILAGNRHQPTQKTYVDETRYHDEIVSSIGLRYGCLLRILGTVRGFRRILQVLSTLIPNDKAIVYNTREKRWEKSRQ